MKIYTPPGFTPSGSKKPGPSDEAVFGYSGSHPLAGSDVTEGDIQPAFPLKVNYQTEDDNNEGTWHTYGYHQKATRA